LAELTPLLHVVPLSALTLMLAQQNSLFCIFFGLIRAIHVVIFRQVKRIYALNMVLIVFVDISGLYDIASGAVSTQKAAELPPQRVGTRSRKQKKSKSSYVLSDSHTTHGKGLVTSIFFLVK
jgi:hypothetical protein